jgi:hypothetical protein
LENEAAPFAQADNLLHSFRCGFVLSHRERAKIYEPQRRSTKKEGAVRGN